MATRPKPKARPTAGGSVRRDRRRPAAAPGKPAKPRARKAIPGKFGIRTAPKGDRFHGPEMAVRKFALGLPKATEDFPWGHRAFRIGKKCFLFLAWDAGVFTATVKLPESQGMALTLPFAEPTGYGMGRSGWVTARFSGRDEVPVPLLYHWIEESYRAVAPKAPARRTAAAGPR